MGEQDINRVERLARRICKSLQAVGAVDGFHLQRVIADADRRRGHLSQRWRQQIRAEAEDTSKTVELALSSGWLVEESGKFSITPTGIEIAKRSRVGHRKIRVDF